MVEKYPLNEIPLKKETDEITQSTRKELARLIASHKEKKDPEKIDTDLFSIELELVDDEFALIWHLSRQAKNFEEIKVALEKLRDYKRNHPETTRDQSQGKGLIGSVIGNYISNLYGFFHRLDNPQLSPDKKEELENRLKRYQESMI